MERPRYNRGMVSLRPWPDFEPPERGVVDEFERALDRTRDSPDEIRGHADQLRAQALAEEIGAVREAKLAMADRYELAAATRLAPS